MGSLNRVTLIGNIGRDAEMRFTASGTPVANFSLATTERYTDRAGEKKEQTEWHAIIVWGKTAEALTEYLTKGKQVCVEGSLQTREWTDKDGGKRKTTEVKAQRIVLLGGGKAEGGGSRGSGSKRAARSEAPAGDVEPASDTAPDDDIPF